MAYLHSSEQTPLTLSRGLGERLKSSLCCHFPLRYFKNMTDNLNRGSYLSAHVLLNLLNEFGKRD